MNVGKRWTVKRRPSILRSWELEFSSLSPKWVPENIWQSLAVWSVWWQVEHMVRFSKMFQPEQKCRFCGTLWSKYQPQHWQNPPRLGGLGYWTRLRCICIDPNCMEYCVGLEGGVDVVRITVVMENGEKGKACLWMVGVEKWVMVVGGVSGWETGVKFGWWIGEGGVTGTF